MKVFYKYNITKYQMELKSDLAKELFDKVIIPIQNKTKAPIINNILNKDEEKSELENQLLSIQEKPDVLPPVPDTITPIIPIDTDTTEPITESVPDNIEPIHPPEPPSIKQCLAEKQNIDVNEDCNPNRTAKRKSLFRYHPDKNVDCPDYAATKFKELTNKCETYIPTATQPPTTPETPSPTEIVLTKQTEPLATPSPTEIVLTDSTMIKPSPTEVVSIEPSVKVVEELKQELPQSLPSVSYQETVDTINIPKDNKDIKRLVHALLGVLRKPEVSKEKSYELVSTTEKPEQMKDIASCDIDETCKEQPLKPLVNVLNNILSKPPPTTVDSDTTNDETTEEVKSEFKLPKTPSIDMSGKLNWITQALSILFSTIGGLFTFEPVQDTDPYELTEDKKNKGYIYVGKMFMKPEDPTKKAESVKYISYNPENKDFFIDEQKEV